MHVLSMFVCRNKSFCTITYTNTVQIFFPQFWSISLNCSWGLFCNKIMGSWYFVVRKQSVYDWFVEHILRSAVYSRSYLTPNYLSFMCLLETDAIVYFYFIVRMTSRGLVCEKNKRALWLPLIVKKWSYCV